jgi:AraC-like DNA-binding protein
MDPLSDVFSLLRVDSMLTARLETRGPWAMRFSAYRHIKFAGVLEGAFWLWIEGRGEPVKIDTGDFYLLTTGEAYCTASDVTLPTIDGREAMVTHRCADGIVRLGEQGEKCVGAGGRFIFDEDTGGLLLSLLPPLVHVLANSPSADPLRAVLDLLRMETDSARPGASVAAASLANMVLVQILRAYLASGGQTPGWLGALADPKIGAALGLMHADIARRWKVEDLASAVAMSRTSFTERFRAMVGMPPLAYLIQWRMAVAGSALRTTDEALSDIAERVGYGSDTAFNSAFKKTTGSSPGRYRAEGRGRSAVS